MKTIPNIRKLVVFAIVLIASSPVVAQNAKTPTPQDIEFLTQYAVRLYEGKEYQEAAKEFQRILTIAPNNRIAQEYLKALDTPNNVPPPERPTIEQVHAITENIETIQGKMIQVERKNRDLEFTVRQLVTENDKLYQMLAKRNRDILELRKKIYGQSLELSTQDLKSGSAKSLDLSVFEKDEELEKMKSALKDYQDQLVERDRMLLQRNEEIRKLKSDIAQVSASFEEAIAEDQKKGATGNPERNQEIADLQKALAQKREALVEKTLALIEKNEELDWFQKELRQVKKDLQTATRKYDAVIEEFEAKFASTQQGGAKKDADRINALQEELKAKTEELAALRTSAERSETKFSDYQQSLKLKDERIAQLDQAILDKDREIVHSKELLMKLRDQIAQKDLVIEAQEVSLNLYDLRMEDIQARVVQVDESLQTNEQSLGHLRNTIRQIRDKFRDHREEVSEKDGTIQDLTRELAESRSNLESVNSSLRSQRENVEKLAGELNRVQNELEQSRKQGHADQGKTALFADKIKALTLSLMAQSQEIEKKNQDIKELGTQMAEALDTIEDRDREIHDLKVKLARATETVESSQQELIRKLEISGKLIDNQDEQIGLYEDIAAVKTQQTDNQKAKVDGLTAQIEYLNTQLFAEQTKNEKMYDRMQDIIEESDVSDLEAALEEKDSVIESQEEILNQRDSKLASVGQLLFDLKEKYRVTQTELVQANDSNNLLKSHIKELEQKYIFSKDLLTKKNEELTSAETKIKELETEVNAGVLRFASLKEKYQESQLVIADLGQKNLLLSGQIEGLEDELSNTRKQLAEKTEELSATQAKIETLTGDLKASKTKIIDKDKEILTLESMFIESSKKTSAEVDSWKNRLAILQKELDQSRSQLALKSKDFSVLEGALLKKGLELESKQKEIDELETRVSQIGSLDLGQGKSSYIQNLEAQLLKSKETIRSMEKLLAEKESIIFDKKPDSVDADRASLNKAIEDVRLKEEANKKLAEDLNRIKSELAHAERYVREKELTIARLEDKVADFESKLGYQGKALSHEGSRVEVLKEEISQKEAVLKSVLAKLEHNMRLMKNNEDRLTAMRRALAEKDEQIKQLESRWAENVPKGLLSEK